ncbi:MAG TPA: hypothetical protein VFS88_09120 [Micavibrio sp.]|nr:hypothetical protein [Micavibrio sp.]
MSRKKIFILLVLLVIAVLGVKEGMRKYPDIKSDLLEKIRQSEIYDLSGVEKAEGFHAKIDLLSAYVHDNSVHHIDDEYYQDRKNKPRALDKFLAHARGQDGKRPHMECYSRSSLLIPLVRKLGFDARMINIFKYEPGYPGHVVVEVKNPDTDKWEVYDPSYSIFWKNEKTGARASAKDIVAQEGFPFTPCYADGHCGYNRKGQIRPPSEDLKEFYGYAVVMNDEREGEIVYNNPARFDTAKPPAGENKAFCDWGGKRWCPALR